MKVDTEVRNRINWFIYAYETFDENEIASNLPDIRISDIREVINEPYTRMSEQEGS